MGAADSVPCSFACQLAFIDTANDKHFGAIDIYRTNESPYQYIMDYKKHYLEDDERLNKYLQTSSQLKAMEHRNLAKIYHVELIQENGICIRHRVIHLFSSYYNFTLEGAIDKKKLQHAFFSENELVYVMDSLLDLALYLKGFGLSAGEYRSQSIFLSPQGHVKLFLLQADPQNLHSCYYKVFDQRSLTHNYIFSPQQLQSLNNFDFKTKFDLFKADLFAIGMVMLELVTLDKPKFYYNSTKTALKIDRISFDLNSMSSRYSPNFINMLKCCLNPIPEDRYTLEEASAELARLKKNMPVVKNCIRLHESELESKRSEKRENGRVGKEHSLKVQKKLTPSPVTSGVSSDSERQLISKTALTNLNTLTLGLNTQTTLRL